MESELTLPQQISLWTQMGFYIVTALSIAGTGILATVKFRTFSRPFVNITLEASSRPCSTEHIQVGVTARLYNGSQNIAKAEQLEWECRGVANYNDQIIEQKINQFFDQGEGNSKTDSGNPDFPWNILQKITKTDLDITIEPNETSHDNVTFVVPAYCTAVQVRLFIPTKQKSGSMGWTKVIYHDTK